MDAKSEGKSEGTSDSVRATVSEDDHSVDRGYAWVIAVAMGLLNAFTWGIAASYGVYLSHYLSDDYFSDASALDYALIGGLSFGASLLITPFTTILARELGHRVVMFTGCAFLGGGFIAASFAKRVWHLYLTQGLAIALGMGMIYIPAIAILPQWFLKRRSLANGISSCGSGLGGLLFSLITNVMIEQISLSWSLRITGILGLAVTAGATCLMKDRNHVVKPHPVGFAMHLLRRHDCRMLLAWAFTNLLGYITIVYSISNYAVTTAGLSQAQASILTALLNLATGLGAPAIGFLSDRYGRIETTTILTLLSAVFVVAIWIPAVQYGVLILYTLLAGSIVGIYWVTVGPLCVEVAGLKELPSFLSWQFMVAVLPTTFAEVIALYLRRSSMGRWQYLYPQIFAAVAYLLASMCLFELWRVKRKGGLLSQCPEMAGLGR